MITYSFTPEDIQQTKSLADVFAVMGISIDSDHPAPYSLKDEKIFGEHGHYANLVLTDKTYREIHDHLAPLGKKWFNRAGQRMPSADALQWSNYGPVSSGPRLKEVADFAGEELRDYTLYIVTPEDSIYRPALEEKYATD